MSPTIAEASGNSIWRHRCVYQLDWNLLGATLERLRSEVIASYAPTAVVAISRGGLVAGTYFSNMLDLPIFVVLGISRNCSNDQWTKKKGPSLDWSSAPLTNLSTERVLLVDDVVGEGATFQTAQHALRAANVSEIRNLAIVRMILGGYPVDYYGLQLDDWVVFPWEAAPSGDIDVRRLSG